MRALPVICHNIDFAWGVEGHEYSYSRDNVSHPSTPQAKSIYDILQTAHASEGIFFWMEGKRKIHIVILLYYI